MNTTMKLCMAGWIYMVGCMMLPAVTIAAPDDIDLSAANPVHTYILPVGQPFNEQIAVLNAGGNVFWEFFNTPTGDAGANFTIMNLTVTLPAGSPDAAVSSGLTTTLSGTPTAAGAFSFTITVTSEDGAQTQNREYEVIIVQPMDVVLVLDRSGSMNSNTTAGVSRWQALKTAVGNFANMYQALSRPDDNLAIVYFETDVNPVSACCNTLVPFSSAIGTTVINDMDPPNAGPGGMTAMGLGMQTAIGKLTDPARARSILLFTDGAQNQNPMVAADGSIAGGGNSPGAIKVATIGIGSPSPVYHSTLQNLATSNRGSYNITQNGTAFTFQAGSTSGDLTSGFTNQFVDMLDDFSPQLVATSTTDISQGSAPHNLISFPLNNRVDKLLLELAFDQGFETPQLVQLLSRILVQKDGVSAMSAVQPSWAGNFPNSILLKFDFSTSAAGGPSVMHPAGTWTVQLADVVNFKISRCRVTAIADDHRLNYQFSYGNMVPRVDQPLKLSAHVDWLSHPVTDATVEAVIMRPGEDLGDLLAKHALTVDLSGAVDAGSPGVQKFDQLLAGDEAFRNALALTENLVTMSHVSDGMYEGTFNDLTVSGAYTIIFRLSGNHPEAGIYRRMKVESFYTSFNGIDLAASQASTQLVNNELQMQIRPVALNGKFIGPAAGDAFAVAQPGVQIAGIEDHQDGRYTLTFTGDVDQPVTLSILGQEVYTGKLQDINKGSGIIDKIQEWLESMGLPGWTLWILILLLLLLIVLMLRKKKT